MSKKFRQHLTRLYINLGGYAVIVHGGDIEFVDEFPDPNVAIDTLAGALWVEGNQNAESFPQLAHEEEIDGEVVEVTYGLNASRHFTTTGRKVDKGIVADGARGMNNPQGLPAPEDDPQTSDEKAASSFSNPSEVEDVPDPPKPSQPPAPEPFNLDSPEKGQNPNTVSPNVPQPSEPKGQNPNTISPNKPQPSSAAPFGETPSEAKSREVKVKKGGSKKK